jgi:outer membrane protein insertion porin family
MDVLFEFSREELIYLEIFISVLPGRALQKRMMKPWRFPENPMLPAVKSIYMEKQETAQSRFSLLTDQILFRPGDIFNHSLYLQSVNEFQNLGMLNIRRFGLSEDGSLPDYSGDEIPVFFDLQTLPKHSVRTEFFGMRRYGFGTGIGLNYSK